MLKAHTMKSLSWDMMNQQRSDEQAALCVRTDSTAGERRARLPLRGLAVLFALAYPVLSATGSPAQTLSLFDEQKAPLAEYSFGTSYDYISQTFFVATLDSASDSIDAASKLNQEYLNQPGLFGSVILRPFRDERIRLAGYVEQSRDYLRGRFSSQLRLRGAQDRLSGNFWLETRLRTNGAREIGDEFVLGRGRLKWSHNLSKKVRPFVAFRAEFNDLKDDDTSLSAFSTGYQKFGGQAGIEFEVGRFDRLQLAGTLESRKVSENKSLEYNLMRLEAEYSGFSGGSFYMVEALFDRRDYDSSGNANDQNWLRLSGSGQFDLGGNFALEPRISFEAIDYALDTSSFNLDQNLTTLELRLLRRWGLTSLSFGPRFQRLDQSEPLPVAASVLSLTDTEDLSESYSEIAAIAAFEYFKLRRIMLTVENQLGSRNVEISNDFQSDYWFDRVSIFSSINIFSALKLDLIGSIEWEWHDQATDDNAFYLLNSSLTYGF